MDLELKSSPVAVGSAVVSLEVASWVLVIKPEVWLDAGCAVDSGRPDDTERIITQSILSACFLTLRSYGLRCYRVEGVIDLRDKCEVGPKRWHAEEKLTVTSR